MSSSADVAATSGAGEDQPFTIEPTAIDLAFSKDDDALNAAPVHTYSVINKERQPMEVSSLWHGVRSYLTRSLHRLQVSRGIVWETVWQWGRQLAQSWCSQLIQAARYDRRGFGSRTNLALPERKQQLHSRNLQSIAKQIASTSSATPTRVNTVGWHTDQDRLMLSGGDDKMFRVWDMRKLAIVQRHTVAAPVKWTAVSRDGLYTAVGVGASQVDIFDIRGSTKALHSHKLPTHMHVRSASFGVDGTLYLAGGAPTDHGLRQGGLWPLPAAASDAHAKPQELWVGHSLDALCVDAHWDSGLMAVGSADATCTLWQVAHGMPTCSVDRPL
mgnify:CR=1 FL=1